MATFVPLSPDAKESSNAATKSSLSPGTKDTSGAAIKANAATWGQLGHLTDAEEEILMKFRDQADSSSIEIAKYTVETYDQCCLRFLRARQFDSAKSLILLKECNEKLTEMKASYWSKLPPDECADCDIAVLKNFYPHTMHGFDKLNRPLLFEHTGGMDADIS